MPDYVKDYFRKLPNELYYEDKQIVDGKITITLYINEKSPFYKIEEVNK